MNLNQGDIWEASCTTQPLKRRYLNVTSTKTANNHQQPSTEFNSWAELCGPFCSMVLINVNYSTWKGSMAIATPISLGLSWPRKRRKITFWEWRSPSTLSLGCKYADFNIWSDFPSIGPKRLPGLSWILVGGHSCDHLKGNPPYSPLVSHEHAAPTRCNSTDAAVEMRRILGDIKKGNTNCKSGASNDMIRYEIDRIWR